jgi:hypothetical protein
MSGTDVRQQLDKVALNSRDSLSKVAQHSKRYYKSTLLATSALFLINGVVLYFGTIFASMGYLGDVSTFYGFKTANEHLQRTAGILCLVVAGVNIAPFLLRNGDDMLVFSVAINIGVFTHYLLEGVIFRGMRLEVLLVMLLFMGLVSFFSNDQNFTLIELVLVVQGFEAQGTN